MLILGIIVALFITISSILMSQKKEKIDPGSNEVSAIGFKNYEVALSATYGLIKIVKNYEK